MPAAKTLTPSAVPPQAQRSVLLTQAHLDSLLRECKQVGDRAYSAELRSNILYRHFKLSGSGFLPMPSPKLQSRVAPFNVGTLDPGVTSAPSRALIPAPSMIYGLSIGTFVPATGLANINLSRFSLDRSNRDPLIVEGLSSTSVLQGVSPMELGGTDLRRPWSFSAPLPIKGNDEMILRARNELGVTSAHFGALFYGEESANPRLKVNRPVSKLGILRFNLTGITLASQGPLTFPFRREARILGLMGFGFNAAGTAISQAVRLNMLLNNDDVITTDFVVDQLLFGVGNVRPFVFPHPFYADSNSALLCSVQNSVMVAPLTALQYILVILYDEERE